MFLAGRIARSAAMPPQRRTGLDRQRRSLCVEARRSGKSCAAAGGRLYCRSTSVISPWVASDGKTTNDIRPLSGRRALAI